jgi:hypothetical protein
LFTVRSDTKVPQFVDPTVVCENGKPVGVVGAIDNTLWKTDLVFGQLGRVSEATVEEYIWEWISSCG